MTLKLISPSESHEQAWKNILAEFKAHGEKLPHGLHLKLNTDEYGVYLAKVRDSEKGINLPEGFPPKSEYFLIEETSSEIIGHVTIRHFLNEYLLNVDGHIGFSIGPSKREKGYGTKQLRLALNICRQMGLEKVMLACNSDNFASAAVIKNNGGVFENVFTENDGTIIERYWIHLE